MGVVSEFLPAGDGVGIVFTEVDAAVLGDLLEQLMALLGEAEEGPPAGSLEEIVGDLHGPADRPADAALARLLPDAYPGDPEASADFRRFTEGSLRARKREAAERALRTLETVGSAQRLDREAALAWLGSLNDLRLVIGTRLGVTEEGEDLFDELHEDDPRRHGYGVYQYLTYLQDSLISALPA